MLDTVEGVSGYTQIHCIWLKSGYNKIQSLMHLMNLGLDTMRYNVSDPMSGYNGYESTSPQNNR